MVSSSNENEEYVGRMMLNAHRKYLESSAALENYMSESAELVMLTPDLKGYITRRSKEAIPLMREVEKSVTSMREWQERMVRLLEASGDA